MTVPQSLESLHHRESVRICPPWEQSGNHWIKWGWLSMGSCLNRVYHSFSWHTLGQSCDLIIVYKKRWFGPDVQENVDSGESEARVKAKVRELVVELQALSRWEDPHFQEGQRDLQIIFWMDISRGWATRECESAGVGKERTIFST